MSNRTNDLRGHRDRNEDWDVNSAVRTEKRGRGRPQSKPSPWEPPFNVSPEALAQAVLRPPIARTSEKNADE